MGKKIKDDSRSERGAIPSIRSPKRHADAVDKIGAGKYPYYAGYSEAFTADMISAYGKGSARLLDPWNGSGTTTVVGSAMGMDAIGIDLNPVMCVVARARGAEADDINAAMDLWQHICSSEGHEKVRRLRSDPLCEWLSDSSAGLIRNAVNLLVAEAGDESCYLNNPAVLMDLVGKLSTVRAILLVGLFQIIREYTRSRKTSNPTWLKLESSGRREPLGRKRLEALMEIELLRLATLASMQLVGEREHRTKRASEIVCATSEDLPLPSQTIDLVLTSPPYCTRIDYAVSTLAELALLGLSVDVVNGSLRKDLIGTTSIRSGAHEERREWGKTCLDLLAYVKDHPSHGSRAYYYKNLRQYFSSLYKSVVEIDRVLKLNASAIFVVQSSYYKERKIDLSKILMEMAESGSLQLESYSEFPVLQSMARINTRARRYRSHNVDTEDVVVFRKTSV